MYVFFCSFAPSSPDIGWCAGTWWLFLIVGILHDNVFLCSFLHSVQIPVSIWAIPSHPAVKRSCLCHMCNAYGESMMFLVWFSFRSLWLLWFHTSFPHPDVIQPLLLAVIFLLVDISCHVESKTRTMMDVETDLIFIRQHLWTTTERDTFWYPHECHRPHFLGVSP